MLESESTLEHRDDLFDDPSFVDGGPLSDQWGRRIKSLRISVTDKCNFRCQYCMPEEGLVWLKKDEILTYEELARLTRILVGMGIESVRLTGGEPLVRRELPVLVRMLAGIPGLRSLSLTTNGYFLKELASPLADAGLTRINVSLDTLQRDKFHRITRRDCFDNVVEGLEECENYPTMQPIKVNAVAMRGFTEEEIPAFVELARRKPYVVRFIEFMPIEADETWTRDRVLSGAEILAEMRKLYPLEPVPLADAAQTSRDYRFTDGAGVVGFINPVSEPFCATCDRIRLTADGHLRTCLFSVTETDLRAPLRGGATDDEIMRILRRAVWNKELKHHINDPGFVRASRSMSQIGG
jgi:cyclic pyranopterin phosphate synthase